MAKCTVCGAKAGWMFSMCDSCMRAQEAQDAERRAKLETERVHVEPAERAITGKLVGGWMLLSIGLIWAGIKAAHVASSFHDSYALSHELDFGNPSPFGIIGFVSLVASFFFLRGASAEHQDDDVMRDLTALNRCDGCHATFPNFNHLTKVEGKGFLCNKCRTTL